MELKDFIKTALLDVVNGVEEANGIKNRFGLFGERHHGKEVYGQYIEFDVGIVAAEKSGSDVKGGLNISMARIGGNLAQEESMQTDHRLKFKIFITETEGR